MIYYVILSQLSSLLFITWGILAMRKAKQMKEHVAWSYEQHKNTIDSVQNLTLELLTSVNTSCSCKDKKHNTVAYGIEELLKARREWIAAQWKP